MFRESLLPRKLGDFNQTWHSLAEMFVLKQMDAGLRPWVSALVQAGETWRWATTDSPTGGGRDPELFNLPRQPDSWTALMALAEMVLVPVAAAFGGLELTYGFASVELTRLVRLRVGRIAPAIDQHAACELGPSGALICKRRGAAVDIRVPGLNSYELGRWIVEHVDFDRLYVYGPDRPIHVSHGPERAGAVVQVIRHNGRAMPRRLTPTALKALI
jgi:hypothetical protein